MLSLMRSRVTPTCSKRTISVVDCALRNFSRGSSENPYTDSILEFSYTPGHARPDTLVEMSTKLFREECKRLEAANDIGELCHRIEEALLYNINIKTSHEKLLQLWKTFLERIAALWERATHYDYDSVKAQALVKRLVTITAKHQMPPQMTLESMEMLVEKDCLNLLDLSPMLAATAQIYPSIAKDSSLFEKWVGSLPEFLTSADLSGPQLITFFAVMQTQALDTKVHQKLMTVCHSVTHSAALNEYFEAKLVQDCSADDILTLLRLSTHIFRKSKLVSPFFFSDIARALHTKTKKLSELQIGNLIRSVSRLSNRNCNEQLRDYSKQCLLQFEGRAALLPQPIILAMKVFARHDPSFAAKCLLDIAAEDLPEFFIPILEAVKGDTALLAVYYLRLLDIAKKEMSSISCLHKQLSPPFAKMLIGGLVEGLLDSCLSSRTFQYDIQSCLLDDSSPGARLGLHGSQLVLALDILSLDPCVPAEFQSVLLNTFHSLSEVLGSFDVSSVVSLLSLLSRHNVISTDVCSAVAKHLAANSADWLKDANRLDQTVKVMSRYSREYGEAFETVTRWFLDHQISDSKDGPGLSLRLAVAAFDNHRSTNVVFDILRKCTVSGSFFCSPEAEVGSEEYQYVQMLFGACTLLLNGPNINWHMEREDIITRCMFFLSNAVDLRRSGDSPPSNVHPAANPKPPLGPRRDHLYSQKPLGATLSLSAWREELEREQAAMAKEDEIHKDDEGGDAHGEAAGSGPLRLWQNLFTISSHSQNSQPPGVSAEAMTGVSGQNSISDSAAVAAVQAPSDRVMLDDDEKPESPSTAVSVTPAHATMLSADTAAISSILGVPDDEALQIASTAAATASQQAVSADGDGGPDEFAVLESILGTSASKADISAAQTPPMEASFPPTASQDAGEDSLSKPRSRYEILFTTCRALEQLEQAFKKSHPREGTHSGLVHYSASRDPNNRAHSTSAQQDLFHLAHCLMQSADTALPYPDAIGCMVVLRRATGKFVPFHSEHSLRTLQTLPSNHPDKYIVLLPVTYKSVSLGNASIPTPTRMLMSQLSLRGWYVVLVPYLSSHSTENVAENVLTALGTAFPEAASQRKTKQQPKTL